MKTLFLSLVLAAGAHAQGVSVDLVKVGHAVKQLHGHVTSAAEWRRATGLVLASADIVDWRTTYIGVVHSGDCEQNKLFNPSGVCGGYLDKPRFNFVKGLVLAVVAGEEIAPKLPHSDAWNRTFVIGNIAMSVVLIPIDISNIHILITQK